MRAGRQNRHRVGRSFILPQERHERGQSGLAAPSSSKEPSSKESSSKEPSSKKPSSKEPSSKDPKCEQLLYNTVEPP